MLMTLYPSVVLYSAMLTRDTFLLFFGLLAAFFIVKLYQTRAVRWLIVLLPVLYAFYDLRGYALVATLGGTAFFIICRMNLLAVAFRRPVLSGVVVLGLCFGIAYGMRQYSSYFDPKILEAQRSTYSGGSSAGLSLNYSSPVSFLVSYAINTVYVVVSPLPWQVSKPQHALGLLESIPLIVFFPMLLAGFADIFRRRAHPASLLVAIAVFQVLAFGLLSDNAGSNARLRIMACALFIVYAAVKWPRWSRAFHPTYGAAFNSHSTHEKSSHLRRL
jgi:hypothetical protein